MAIPTVYNTGTASINAGETALTGQGTSWLTTGISPGDLFWAAGLFVRIATVNSNTSITLAYAWPGATRNTAVYEIAREPDEVRVLEASRQLLTTLTNGNLSSIAALASAANKLPYYQGAGSAALADFTPAARAILALAGATGAKIPVIVGANSAALRDIVGAVSQSGGVPTGAIVERGSNANGEYVRFADGTQICTRTDTVTTTVDVNSGGMFVSSVITTSPYAAAFLSGSSPAGTISIDRPSGTPSNISAITDTIGTTSTVYRVGRTTADAVSRAYSARILSVGRWF